MTRIAAVEAVPVTFSLAREPMSYCFVRVEADDGTIGWGEACDSYGCTFAGVLAAVVRDAFAPLLAGVELEAVEPLVERLRLFTRRRLGDQWVAAQARSAVEIALWDVLGQAAGRSVSRVIGRVRDRVGVYASSVFLEEGDAGWHADLLGPVLDRGVTMVKVRIGPAWRDDVETLEKLRGLLPPSVEVMVDGSETFTLPTALDISRRLHDLGVTWFEEPMSQGARAGIEELVARSPVAIAYGEHLYGRDDAIDALRHRQLDVLQPDASTCGGIGEARQIAALATSFGVRVVPHVCAGPVSLVANLHAAATLPAVRVIEYPYTMAPAWDALGVGASVGVDAIVDGALPVPDSAGLGMALNEAVAESNPYRPPGTRVAGTRGGLPDRFAGDR